MSLVDLLFGKKKTIKDNVFGVIKSGRIKSKNPKKKPFLALAI